MTDGDANEATENDGEDSAVSQEETTQASVDSSEASTSSDSSQETSREGKPEWMSNRAWDEKFSKSDSLNMEEVAKYYADSHNHAEKALHNRKDVIRGEIEQELLEAAYEGVPESSLDYEFDVEALGEEYGLTIGTTEDDPLLMGMKAWAHEHNLTQDEFNDLTAMHLEAVTQFFPDWDQEMELLGPYADERAAHLNTWLSKNLTPDSYKAMEKLALSADMIVALEELQELSGVVKFSTDTGGGKNRGLEKSDIMKLMDTEEYRNGDPATLQKVQAGFKRLSSGRKSA